jgi:hypothetical protein
MFPSRVDITEVGARDDLQALSPFAPTETLPGKLLRALDAVRHAVG